MKDYLLTPGAMGPIVYFCLGFLCAALLSAVLMPFLRRRAVRLAQQRRQAAVQLVAKVRAKKNEMSAEFARTTRNFEIEREELKDTIARQRVELGRHGDSFNQLRVERNALKMEVEALRDQALPNSDAPSLQPSTSKAGPMFLPLEPEERARLLEANKSTSQEIKGGHEPSPVFDLPCCSEVESWLTTCAGAEKSLARFPGQKF